MSLGDKIKRARDRLGLSQQELADLLLVDRKSVWNWEQGHTHPGRAHLHALEQVLGALNGAPDDLFTLATDIRNSRELTAGQKQVLLGLLGDRPHGRHAVLPAYPAGWLTPAERQRVTGS
jgi:transcriptional regulator with XRE-family HTH domain